MELLKTFAREAVAMFVSDAQLVAGVLIWAAAVAYGLHAALVTPIVAAVALATGVAALLVFDVIWASRAAKPRIVKP